MAQNFGGLATAQKHFCRKHIGQVPALHSKSARIKLLANKTLVDRL